jgi:hypothetical protein
MNPKMKGTESGEGSQTPRSYRNSTSLIGRSVRATIKNRRSEKMFRQLRRLWRSNFVGRKLGNLRRIANAVMFFFNAQLQRAALFRRL